MTPIERLGKLLEQATIPYEKPSIVFEDNARVIVWAENEKGRDIATFRHGVTMEADAMLYIEAVRLLPDLLAAYDATAAECHAWRGAWKRSGAFDPMGMSLDDAACAITDSAVARVEGER
jgi:hypothetical protein